MGLLLDIRYALRQLRRHPGFSATAILSLALAIAANAAIFSVVDALLLRPLAVPDGGRLLRIGLTVRDDRSFRAFSHPDYVFLRDHVRTLDGLIGHQPQPASFAGPAGPGILWAEIVTGNYFDVLEVPPSPGRGFRPDEDAGPGAPPAIVISQAVWRRMFASDPGAIGRTVRVNGRTATIVGVAPAGFSGTFPGFAIDFWIPTSQTSLVTPRESPERRSDRFLMLTGRPKPGVSAGDVLAELKALVRQLAAAYPDVDRDIGVAIADATGVHPFIKTFVGAFLALLMAIVGLVMLIACANVAGLLLARAASRRREIATRLAVGASRGRVIQQLLTESAILGLAAGGVGLTLSVWLIRVLNAFGPPTGVPIALNLSSGGRVIAFTVVLSVVTSVVFGLLPALQASRQEVGVGLRGLAPLGLKPSRLRSALVVMQVASSIVLLVGALLLVRSLVRSGTLDPGFNPDHVYVTSFDAGLPGYPPDRVHAFYEALLARVRALPGVESVAVACFVMMGDRGDQIPVSKAGVVARDGEAQPGPVAYNTVSADYFSTLQIPIVRGRAFDERDGPSARKVIIVNEPLQRRLYAGEDPIGQHVRLRGETFDREVVGVVKTSKYGTFGESPRPFLYVPYQQFARFDLTIHVRSARGPAGVLPAIGQIARGLDADVPGYDARPMRESMAFSLVPAQVASRVLGASGVVALILAMVGLYGVVSYSVSQRTREIGVRMALGATPRDVLRLILAEGARLTAIGVVLGAAAAAGATQTLRSFLFGISALDPATFGAVAALLAVVALLAAYVPARRGMRVAPTDALRYE